MGHRPGDDGPKIRRAFPMRIRSYMTLGTCASVAICVNAHRAASRFGRLMWGLQDHVSIRSDFLMIFLL